MQVQAFIKKLSEIGIDFYVGVPCSFFKSAINYVIDLPGIEYHMASNEGSALAIASGAALAGRKPVVMLQNSGVGNMVNPLTSLSMIYKIPVLLLVSGRAYKVDDQPQHFIMGSRLPEIFEGFGLKWLELPTDEEGVNLTLEHSIEYMQETDMPIALIVQKDTLSDHILQEHQARSIAGVEIDRYKLLRLSQNN